MPSTPKVGFVSLGCPKALVDSERILTQLRTDGYEISASYANADVVVVNTCGFIDSAKAESLEAIGEAMAANGRVIVTGCMGAQADEITEVYPKVLSISGPQQYEQVISAVHQHAPQTREHDPLVDLIPPQGVKLTPRHYAYLKISEGCNHKCTFCIIPDLRGRLVSRPAGSVLAEAERLVKSGVRELLVISQDTSAYGVDLKYKLDFWDGQPVKSRLLELCQALSNFGVWVRLHYVYPYPSVDSIIPLMAERKILPYLDIPFQHASPRVLKAMRRPAAAENTLATIKRWREICPEISLRSTFIVGFPGETEAEFQCLLDFLEQAQLDRVGCFQYSPVAGARANELADHIPEELMQDRWERLMRLQADISCSRLANKVGQEIEVLVDSVDGDTAIARSWADAPEIDGVVQIAKAADLQPGDCLKVVVNNSDDYDLYAALERRTD